jgi:hypothetical protein
MGYFAKINQRRIVTDVIVATEEQVETMPGTWIETFKDGNYRKNYAGIDYSYDYFLDCFIPPQLVSGSTLDTNTCLWIEPTPLPTGSI